MSKNIDEHLTVLCFRARRAFKSVAPFKPQAEAKKMAKQAILTDLMELKPLTTVDGPVNVWEQRIKNYIQGA